MVNNRPMNAMQVTQTPRFHGHAKGMGEILETENNNPVLQVINSNQYYGRLDSRGLYQGLTKSGQYKGMGDLSTSTVDLSTAFPVTGVSAVNSAGQSFTSNTFSDAMFDWL